MKTTSSHAIYLGILLLFFSLFNSQKVYTQTADSLAYSTTSNGDLQFQLIGGIGVYYIGNCTPASQFRIGVDFSLNHSDESGTTDGYSATINPPPSSSSSSVSTNNPDQTSNSYRISISGLYLKQIAEYSHTYMYCGVGPMVNYSWYRNRNTSPYTSTGSNIYSSTSNNESTSKTSGLGPIVIFGVRSHLLAHVGLSAEIGLSSIYQWTTQTSSSTSTSTYSTSSPTTYIDGNVSNFKGWNVSLSSIRVGLIIGL